MAGKALTIKLEVSDNENQFGRESWYGVGPFASKINDDGSLALKSPGQDTQIVTPSENKYGTYWTVNLFGGKCFASVMDHEKYGRYMRIKLGNSVELPAEVKEKISYKPKAKKSAPKKASVDLW